MRNAMVRIEVSRLRHGSVGDAEEFDVYVEALMEGPNYDDIEIVSVTYEDGEMLELTESEEMQVYEMLAEEWYGVQDEDARDAYLFQD